MIHMKTTTNGRRPQNIKSWISQQPMIRSSSNFKLKLRGPNQNKKNAWNEDNLQTPTRAFLVAQTLEERRQSLKSMDCKIFEPDMSASPQLKQRNRQKTSKRKPQMSMDNDQVKQGRVYTITKKFDTMEDIPSRRKRVNSQEWSTTTPPLTLFRQMPEQTEEFGTLASPEMALQFGWAARPMAQLEQGHVTSGEAAQLTTALTPSLRENQVEGSHFGK
jgi:hypothetical protein